MGRIPARHMVVMIAVAAFGYYATYALSGRVAASDEGYLLALASMVARGARLYRDLELYSYMPGLFYLFTIGAPDPDDMLVAARWLMATLLALNAALLFLVARMAGAGHWAVPAALALAVAPGAWYKAYQPTLWLLLLLCILGHHARPRVVWLVALGAVMALGVALRIEVTFAAVVMLAALGVCLRWEGRGQGVGSSLLAVGVGVALTLLPWWAVLHADGILSEHLQQLVDIPRRIFDRLVSPHRIRGPAITGWLPGRVLGPDGMLYWLSFIAPLGLALETWRQWRVSRPGLHGRVAAGTCGLTLVWVLMNLPQYAWERADAAHLAERWFALLVAAAVSWSRLMPMGPLLAGERRPWFASLLGLMAGVFALAFLAIHLPRSVSGSYSVAGSYRPAFAESALPNGLRYPNADPGRALIERVIRDTRPDEPVAALPYLPGFHFATGRPVVARRIYLLPFNTRPEVEREYLCELDRAGVRYVMFGDHPALVGGEHLRLRSYAPLVDAHLARHFEPVGKAGHWQLLRRVSPGVPCVPPR